MSPYWRLHLLWAPSLSNHPFYIWITFTSFPALEMITTMSLGSPCSISCWFSISSHTLITIPLLNSLISHLKCAICFLPEFWEMWDSCYFHFCMRKLRNLVTSPGLRFNSNSLTPVALFTACTLHASYLFFLNHSFPTCKMGSVTKIPVMVSFMSQFNWATGYPAISLNIISGCVCYDVLEEISIWIDKLNKADGHSQCGLPYPIHWRPEENEKMDEAWICFF